MAALGDRGDALADQRPARRALDPQYHSVRAGLPLELLDRRRLDRRGGPGRVAAAAEILDPGDEVADLGLAALGRGAERPPRRGGGDFAAQSEIAGAEAGEGVDDVGRQVAAVAEQAAGDRAEARQQLEPFVGVEPGAGEQGRGDGGQILGEEGERGRADPASGEGPGDLAPGFGRDLAPVRRSARPSASAWASPSLRPWATRSTSWRHLAASADGRASLCLSTVAIMSSKRKRPALRERDRMPAPPIVNARSAASGRGAFGRRRNMGRGDFILPSANGGEGDHAKHGGGVIDEASASYPSTTLRWSPSPCFAWGGSSQAPLRASQASQKAPRFWRGPVSDLKAASAPARSPEASRAMARRVLTRLASTPPLVSAAR